MNSHLEEERSGKRKRMPAFSNLEKDLLKDLVLKYKACIENKSTDSATLKNKNDAWSKISEEFNCVPNHIQRTNKQLRKLWDNLKTERKRELSVGKKEVTATGGGPPINIPKNDPTDVLQETFMTEITEAVENDTLVLAESGNEGIIVLKNAGALESVTTTDSDGASLAYDYVEILMPDYTNDSNKISDISKKQEERGESATSLNILATPHNVFRSGRGGIRQEILQRSKRIEQQIQNDAVINSYLVKEARFRALAAEEVYKEKMLLRQKAELELEIKNIEYDYTKKKYQQ